MKVNDTGTADKAAGFSTTVSERRQGMKRFIIAFITWLLAGVTVTAAWAAGPAKPVIEAEMPDCYSYIGGSGIPQKATHHVQAADFQRPHALAQRCFQCIFPAGLYGNACP